MERPDPRSLARARRELRAAAGRARLDVILEAPDPGALVRSLPAEELYFAIHEIGLADAAELVQLASPAQFRTFLDLDAWRGSAVDPLRILPWLRAGRAAAGRSDREAARWKRKLGGLDPEILSLVLAATLRIHDLEQDPDPRLQSDRILRTPEGRYVIEFLADGIEYLAVRGLVDDLYAEDPLVATRALAAVRSELRSEMEESALRWRQGRLADLGFPDAEEALSWFARPPPGPPGQARAGAEPPGFFLAAFEGRSLLDRAAARLPPPEREAFERQLMGAANAVMVADRVDPADLRAVRAAVERARATLEMGLEALSGGDEARAATVLAETALKRIFQHAFGRILELGWRARRLLGAGPPGEPEPTLLDPPLGEALAALARRRPLYFPGLEAPREAWGTPASAAFEPRAFLSSAEVGRATAALDLAAGLTALAGRLGLSPPSPAPSPPPRLAALYLTALANERLGRPFRAVPIPRQEVPAAARVLERPDDPRLATEGEAGALLAALARARAAELAALPEGGEIEPGLVSALLVRS